MFRCPACRERCIPARDKLSNLRKCPCPACGASVTFSAMGLVLAQFMPFVALVPYLWLVPNPSWWGFLLYLSVAGLAASLLFFLYATPLYVAGSRAARIDWWVTGAILIVWILWAVISGILSV